jgi:spermidine synthase
MHLLYFNWRSRTVDVVKPWIQLAQTTTPDGKTISLHEHDGSYAIRVDGAELMSTRQHASEERLGELACAHLKDKKGARILAGGLGFGFTLRAVLRTVPADAAVIVAEILPAVIAWNRDPRWRLASDALSDRRVVLREQDVAEGIRKGPGSFDSIVLDIDNGPVALSTLTNGRLYDSSGLHSIRQALRPGGCAAFWSAAPDPVFEKRMAGAGFRVEVQQAHAHGTAGRRHTLILGRRP